MKTENQTEILSQRNFEFSDIFSKNYIFNLFIENKLVLKVTSMKSIKKNFIFNKSYENKVFWRKYAKKV